METRVCACARAYAYECALCACASTAHEGKFSRGKYIPAKRKRSAPEFPVVKAIHPHATERRFEPPPFSIPCPLKMREREREAF
eukprot:6172010-Pleurochrysis_carterae.AAC.1